MKHKFLITFIATILTLFVGRFVFAQYINIDQNSSSIENPTAVLKINERSGNNIIFGTNDISIINSSGNIGIYTVTPSYKLEVVGKGYFSSPVFVGSPTTGTHAVTKSYVDSMVGGGIASGTSGQTLRHDGASWVANSLLYNDGTNVGIGTTSPTVPLNLYNLAPPSGVLVTFETAGNNGSVRIASTGSSWELIAVSNGLHFYNDNTSAYRVSLMNAGNVGIGTATPAYLLDVAGAGQFDGTVSVGSPTVGTHAATKSYADTVAYSFWNLSSNNINLVSSGNVGIGTASPQTKLDINGTLKVSGFQLGTSTTAGYVLTVDSSGNGTWQAYNAQSVVIGASENVMYLRGGNSDPKSFTWQIHTGYSPDTYVTCPTGFTKWWSNNAYYYSSEAGYQAYTGACYPTTSSNDLFKWRSPSTASVTCPSGYTKWVNTWWDVDPSNNTGVYDGVCYKGTTLPSFSWRAYTYGAQACPTGLTNWYEPNYAMYAPAWYEYCVDEPTCSTYDYTYDYWSYSGACYNSSLTNDVFTWKSYSSATSVSCPAGYTRWVGQYAYGPLGNQQIYSGACYKGNPPSFIWESYTGLGNPSTVTTCPTGFTNWSNTSAVYYNAPISGYQAYTGACVNNTSTDSDSFIYQANAASNSITCPTGYAKYTNTQLTYKRYSSQSTFDSACYRINSQPAPSCPAGWSSAPTSTATINSVDVNEQICYRTDAPYQVLTVRSKGLNQSLSCPAGWSGATASSTNIGGNSERVCFAVSCPSGMTIPAAPTGLSATPGVSASLSWNSVSNGCASAQTYKVYRSTTSGSGFTVLASGVTSTTYLDSAVTGGVTYYYKISSVNSAGEGSQTSEVSALIPSALYAFTTHTFTNCSMTGATGPTLANCQSAYSAASWASNTSYFNVTAGIQYWTVPENGTYTIDVYGAQGYGNNPGGYGARIKGDVVLTGGTILKILVGQMGSGSYGGGGGGSFVTTNANSPIMIAGGGGPVTPWNSTGSPGQAGTSGASGNGAAGGSGGNGGYYASGSYSPSGAGLTGNGMYGTMCGSGSIPYSFVNGGAGSTSCNGIGGFGGGSASDGCCCGQGAAGGGYSGGGGATGCGGDAYGGGGGSYNSGTNQTNTTGARSGHGQVIITKN